MSESLRIVSTTVDVLDSLSFEQVKGHLVTIVECGELIGKLPDAVVSEKSEKVILKLRELERKIIETADKVNRHFNVVKSSSNDLNFYMEAGQLSSTLTKFLKDTITRPSCDNVEIFRSNCAKLPPLHCAYKMISILEQEETNPLIKAMRAESTRSRAIFDKWRIVFNEILSQFLFLECIINGMFWWKNMIGPENLAEKIELFNRKMDTWFAEYKEKFWPDAVRELVHEIQDKYTHVGNQEKAAILQRELSKSGTKEAYYIMVYDACGADGEYAFHCLGDTLFESNNRGGCNVAIYRSLNMNPWTTHVERDLNELQKEVESCKNDTIPCRSGISAVPADLMNNRINNAGFVGLIREGNHVAIQSANSWRAGGPGCVLKECTSFTLSNDFQVEMVPAFVLIVGYQ